jgi:Ca-activated chloride channel family protein
MESNSLQPNSKQKGTKNYLKHKLTASTILFWILFGFLGGAAFGQLLFYTENKNAVRLSMAFSSEKAGWISATQAPFLEYWNAKRALDPTLPQIILDFQPYGSGDSLIALLNGEIKPVIWSPASNIWMPILNTKWQQLTQDDDPIIKNSTRVIYSPVVIATWENFYAQHPFGGINDLHELIVQNPGQIRIAHTDPRSSNSGFMATVMLVSSRLQMDPEAITVANLSNPDLMQWMHEFQGAALFYGKSTGFLGIYMRDQGPDALHATILYENLVQEYSKAAEAKYGQKIIAVYPEEGALFSDHPFCVLNAKWVSAEQAMVAEEYLNFLKQPENLVTAIQNGFRPIDASVLAIPALGAVYNQSFNEAFGVTNDPTKIIELTAPADGTVISRIPDLWLLTRNTAV